MLIYLIFYGLRFIVIVYSSEAYLNLQVLKWFFGAHFPATMHVPMRCGSVEHAASFSRIATTSAKIIALPTPDLHELNCMAAAHIANAIAQDITQPLNWHFITLPSGCAGTSPWGPEPLTEDLILMLFPCHIGCPIYTSLPVIVTW